MRTYLKTAMLAAALCSGGAALAGEPVSISRAVDARTVNLDLDGVISVKVTQGPSAALIIYGEREALDKVTVDQSGDTLRIATRKTHSINLGGKNDLHAELTLPNLRRLVSGGIGATEVTGFSGDQLRLALEGAGAVKVNAQYHNLDVTLGGVGGMIINGGNSENIELRLDGAGHIELTGQTRQLHANLGGLGSLDAQKLRADQVDVNMTGLGSATVYAKNSASLVLTGLGSATVYGNPAYRKSSARGLGSVSWQ